MLEDNSLWEIDQFDKLETFMWLTMADIVVLPTTFGDLTTYRLVNTDDDDKVGATFRGFATRAH